MSIEVGTAYISILPSTDGIAPGMRGAFRQVERDAGQAGQDAGEEFSSGFGDVLKKGAGLAAGLVLGAGLTDGITQALDQGQMNAKLGASLGLSEAQAEKAGKVAGSLFSANYGESVEEVNDALRSVIQNIGGMRKASEGDLEAISAKVLNTADVFDQDLGAVTRGVGQMMKTGMAKDANEALDILTAGFQRGADKSEDFLDTMNEYGTQFRKLGIDGKTATGLISQGLQAGARDGDLVADALKEFSIRAKDGSASSAEAFAAMGLDAEKMTAKIANGGKGASDGLAQVLDSLRAMKDPVKREAAAVGIFGTQAEDLGDALFALRPDSAVKALGKVGGAADRANEAMGSTPDAKIKTFTRTLQQGFVDVLGGKVIPAVESFVGWLKQNSDTLLTIASVVGPLVAGLTAYLVVTKAIAIGTAVWTAATALLNGTLLLNPIGLVVAAIVALVAGLVIAYKRSETFRNIVNAAFSKVKSVAQGVANFFTTKVPAAFAVVKDAAGRAIGWVRANWQKILGILTGPIGIAVGLIAKNWTKIRNGASAAKDFIAKKFNDLVGFFRSIPGRISSATSGMWNGIKESFRSVMNWLIGKWNNFSITIDIPDKIPGLPDEFTLSTPNLPMFAKGGIVNKPTLGVFGEAGPEAIVPLSHYDKQRETAVATAAANAAPRVASVQRGGGRTAFVITNWRTGEGYFRSIAEDVVADEAEFDNTVGRMR